MCSFHNAFHSMIVRSALYPAAPIEEHKPGAKSSLGY